MLGWPARCGMLGEGWCLIASACVLIRWTQEPPTKGMGFKEFSEKGEFCVLDTIKVNNDIMMAFHHYIIDEMI